MKKRIEAAVIEYTGDGNFKLDVVPDPQVAGVWAGRVVMGDGYEWHLLWSERDAVEAGNDAMAIEEVEFECWPPKRAKNGVGSWRVS